MPTIGNIVNMIVLLIVLVVAGGWSFGIYGAAAGLALAVAGVFVVLKLPRTPARDRRFGSTDGGSDGGER